MNKFERRTTMPLSDFALRVGRQPQEIKEENPSWLHRGLKGGHTVRLEEMPSVPGSVVISMLRVNYHIFEHHVTYWRLGRPLDAPPKKRQFSQREIDQLYHNLIG